MTDLGTLGLTGDGFELAHTDVAERAGMIGDTARDFAPLTEHQGVMWLSRNGGDSWELGTADHRIVQRPHYYSRAAVAPDDPDEIRFMSVRHSLSLDAGKTISSVPSGFDHHDIWIDPEMPDRIILGHDGGVTISTNRGKTWFRPQLPIAQMYHVYTDNQIPYFVYGNRQDGPSTRGPSNSLTGGPIPIGEWRPVGGCESGFAVPDLVDINIVWSGCFDGILERHDRRTGHSRNVSVWPRAIESWPASDVQYRFQWTFPVTISPHDHNRVYVGSQFVHMTENAGQSYRVISGDLTTNDVSRQQKTGGLTPDDAGPTIAPVVFAIAESFVEEGLVWAGTNDGLVHVTRDGGLNWSNVTANLPGIPTWGTISNIEPSRYEAGTTYLSVDAHQVNDTQPYIYRTKDFGSTWDRMTTGIPSSTHSYVHVVREDPRMPGLLYAGTENGLYFSLNDGIEWQPLQTNLPHAPVHWLEIQDHFSDLVVATYGRGFWILDDITPLRQLTNEVLNADVHLFKPRPAYRFRPVQAPHSQPGDPAVGQNPTYGASLHYFLKEEPEDSVNVTILDSQGETVRELSDVPAGPGINRVYWDLRYEAAAQPELRTKPNEHSHIEIPPDGWRPLEEARRVAPLGPPGTYTVKLQVGDQEWTEEIEVLKDPNSTGTEADIARQLELVMDLREMVDSAVEIINDIEWARKQIQDLLARLDGREDIDDIEESGRALDEKLQELEGNFFDLRLTGSGQDTLRWRRRLYADLTSLMRQINQSDFRPTDQQGDVYLLLKEELAEHSEAMDELRGGEISEFNALLRTMEIPNVIVTHRETPEP